MEYLIKNINRMVADDNTRVMVDHLGNLWNEGLDHFGDADGKVLHI